MSRGQPITIHPLSGFPRVSGDEPDTSGQSGGENRFSPRERG